MGGAGVSGTRIVKDELLQGDDLRSLTGILHTDMSADEIRAERLKKQVGATVTPESYSVGR